MNSTWYRLNRDADEFCGITPSNLAAMINDQAKIVTAIGRDMHTAQHNSDERLHSRLFLQHCSAIDRRNAIQYRLNCDFAAARGWNPSPSPFGLRTLARGTQNNGGQRYHYNDDNPEVGQFRPQFDHPNFFCRNRKAAAIAAHLYNWPQVQSECQEIADHFNLSLEIPDFPSWYYPGGTTLVLYTGPAGR
jgi:hypothetical protein